MKIEFDWRIIEGEDDEPEPVPLPPPRPRRRLPRWLIALAAVPVLAIAILTGYAMWVYRTQLSRATREVSVVAKSEEQAIAARDEASFMALQDPDDPAWRTMQERSFGRAERSGLPEYGWRATGAPPEIGSATLEPGGALLDVTYQFTVTQPMPGGPMTVTLRVPQFYKPTPSGWVHGLPGADFWGPKRSLSGTRVLVLYSRRDADVVEPLIPSMDRMLDRVCANLTCPSQVTVTFETSPDSVASVGWRGYSSFGSGDTFKFLSPYLTGLPADEQSRDELYRAIETRVVRGLVTASLARRGRSYGYSAAYQQIERWYLAQAGLSGPFITPSMTSELVSAMQTGTWQPLSAIPLQSRSTGTNDVMLPLAFEFVASRFGADSLARLAPAMATSSTVGEAMRTALHVNPMSLESDWQKYLLAQAGLAPMTQAPSEPCGELALECGTDQQLILDSHTGAVLLQKRGLAPSSRTWSADGRYVAFQPEPDSSFRAGVSIVDVYSHRQVSLLGTSWDWSPDGKWLAVTQNPSGVLITTPDGAVTRRLDTPSCSNVAWRPFS